MTTGRINQVHCDLCKAAPTPDAHPCTHQNVNANYARLFAYPFRLRLSRRCVKNHLACPSTPISLLSTPHTHGVPPRYINSCEWQIGKVVLPVPYNCDPHMYRRTISTCHVMFEMSAARKNLIIASNSSKKAKALEKRHSRRQAY